MFDFATILKIAQGAGNAIPTLTALFDQVVSTFSEDDQEKLKSANKILFCDTNLYVIKIWSNFKFGQCDPEILKHIEERKYDLYLLTYIDIPWQDDPQREHPHEREALYQLYLNEMKEQTVPFVEISGLDDDRKKKAVTAIQTLLKLS